MPDPLPVMLTITTPSSNSTVERTFIVSGTCNVNHPITVKVVEPNSGTYRAQTPQAVDGKWETTYYTYPAGTYKITAICGNMTDPIELVNVTVE